MTTGVPALSNPQTQWFSSLSAGLWATGFVFCRTAFFDVLDMQGDRIVGKETLPILLDTSNILKLLKIILIVLIAMSMMLGALQVLSPLAYALAICPFLLLLIIRTHESNTPLSGVRIVFMVEGLFLLAGLITVGYLYI